MKFAIIGFGDRGKLYRNIISRDFKDIELVAICDKREDVLKKAKIDFNLRDDQLFNNEDDFFKKGKIADFVLVTTTDSEHHRQFNALSDLGYDILLEKPISVTEEECVDMLKHQRKNKNKVAVCHVLRYTPFYSKIKKIIDSKILGDVVTLSQTENVAYWHQAHSFVRGNWKNSNTSAPMILAKCCHDMDMFLWLMNSRCEKVSSFGSLSYFNRNNKPEGSADRCVDCKLNCVYNAYNFYSKYPIMYGKINEKKDDVREFLKKSDYGKCVFASDNNVVDHQVVNCLFENGATAQLTMTAFSADCHRYIKIHCTKGELEGDIEANYLKYQLFGEEKPVEFDFSKELEKDIYSVHSGGDTILIREFIESLSEDSKIKTDLNVSMQSHFMCFAAERSRINDGQVETVNKGE